MGLVSLLRKTNLEKETLPALPYRQSIRKVYYTNEIGFMSQITPLYI
jgi:hypothetical protein